MVNSTIPSPHGGCGLVNRILPDIEREVILTKQNSLKSYHISDADLSIFYRIADGALSPLEGPMESDEFHNVLDREVIERGGKKYTWTIPIGLPIAQQEAAKLEIGETVFVKNTQGIVVGILEIASIYPFDKKKYNQAVYGTERTDHPGARIFNADPRDVLLGGKIWAFPQPRDQNFGRYMLKPWETRALFQKRGWERTVAFQTRNALHRAHEYALLYATESLIREGHFTGAVLNPLVGATKDDDVPAGIRMRTYEALLKAGVFGIGDEDQELWETEGYYFKDQLLLIGLDMKMFYAGPK